ncbi:MAG: sulfate ABC transporter ATP-binding protein [Armatimonadetes bacterium]|nr:sulfate ABC transporter ATP-binding protein [Armatimonadota bacterium]
MSIEVRSVNKTFGAFKALNEVSLKVETGELVALLGPSGSGKTTLLRIIAGLETPDTGDILFSGEDTTEKSVRDRRVGFVFQHYALFRHMSVFENIAFGLRVRPRSLRPSNADIQDRVMSLLKMVQLEGLAKRFPSQLSGGQRQRVALARALAVEPRVLLLDEPFGALDAKVRQDLRRWLRRLHDDLHITSVFVTHDQEEALEVSDRVVVMNKGKIEQIGAPDEVYDHPTNPFVFNFLGNVNLFHGRIHEGQSQLGPLAGPAPEQGGVQDAPVIGYARPHELDIARSRNGAATVEAIVRHIYAAGPLVRLDLERRDNGGTIAAELTRERYADLKLKVGEEVHVKPRNMRVFLDDKEAQTEDYSI